MTLFASETPELSDRSAASPEFAVADASSAFSQELLRLSQQPAPPYEQNTAQESPTDILAPNTAVEALPPVFVEPQPLNSVDLPAEQSAEQPTGQSVEQPTGQPVEQPVDTGAHLDGVANTILDVGLGTAALAAGELVAAALTRNPKFAAMAAETIQTGGKVAFFTSPKIMAPLILPNLAAFGAATAVRHYVVEGLTGKSESWLDSANHVGLGSAPYGAFRFLRH
ncbi:MAG: hypothetical protein JST89_00125 [Cyanobacteria bacterium SZAS-4]|nr:hypothetical protein [Cyanobacteria bacterium SZAS-4]